MMKFGTRLYGRLNETRNRRESMIGLRNLVFRENSEHFQISFPNHYRARKEAVLTTKKIAITTSRDADRGHQKKSNTP